MARLRGSLVMATLVLSGGFASLSAAQVTYSIFPAQLSQPLAEGQPTGGHGAALVTLSVQDSTVGYVVRELTRQAHLQVLYDNTDPKIGRRIRVYTVNMSVMTALATALKGTGLVATLKSDGETVVVRVPVGSAEVGRSRIAEGVIVGHVTDSASGAGLGGASVKVEGTKASAITSDSGNFTIRDVLAGDQVLTVRLFGYRPTERTVTVVDSERTTVRVVMVPVPTVLSGIVTTATGLQRKVEVGNDITTLNVDSIMQTAPITSVTDLLEARVPGLTVQHTSGAPGDPARLRLRGASSIYGNNDPIVIVDGVRVYASQSDPRNDNLAPNSVAYGTASNGVATYAAPSPLDQIDPNNIETIEVLKGPSASALYGSDAAGGVIVITTKHGRAGPTHWSADVGFGVNWLPGQWPVNDFAFGNDTTGVYTSSKGFCDFYFTRCIVDSLVPFQALNDPRYTVFSRGSDRTANLTVSGGTPALTYSLTGGGTGDIGYLKLPAFQQQVYEQAYGTLPSWMVRPDNYQTWSVGGQLTAQPTTTAHVTLTSSLFNSNQQKSSLQNAITQLEGEFIFPALLDSQPLVQNYVQRVTSNQLSSTNSLTFTWQPVSWLPLNAVGGLNIIQRSDESYVPYGICPRGSPLACSLSSTLEGVGNSDTTGAYGLGRGTSRDQTLTIGTSIPMWQHRVSLAVGGDLYANSSEDFTAFTDQLAPGVSTPTSFPTENNASDFSQSTSDATTYGVYVQTQLHVFGSMYLNPGFRLDGGSGGSTSSGSVDGLSAFPKIDLSYLLVDRQNERPVFGVLTLLRPRIAFGFAGTQPAPQDRLRLFNVGGYQLTEPGNVGIAYQGSACTDPSTFDGSTYVPTVCLNSLGNTALRPERTSELEGGFDAELWHGRLSLTYTQYNKTRYDAILSIPVAPSVSGSGIGGRNILKNIGVIRNTGTELVLNATVLQSRALSWIIGANLSSDNSLVVRLNAGQPPICFGSGNPCQGTRIIAGYPLFGEWAQPIASFADANHDGVIEPSEIRLADSAVYVGQPDAKYQLNLTSDVTLLSGRLSVHVTFAYQNGLTQDDQAALTSGALALLGNEPNTPLATQAAIVSGLCSNLSLYSDVAQLGHGYGCQGGTAIGLYQTVNTFRLNDLSINYNVPQIISTKFRVPRMTIAIQGSNLALHSNYRGKDPAVNAFSTVGAGDETADSGQIPEPRTWWLRITVGN